jgi:hypothetical protein
MASGRPAKRSWLVLPTRCSENEGLRASLPSVRRVILSLRSDWMVCSSSSISREVSLSFRDATSSNGCCTRSRYAESWVLSWSSSMVVSL